MASIKNNLVLLCVATCALSFVLHQTNAANDLVRNWCQRTDYNDLCVSEIEADPRENLKNSPNGLCNILRDRAVANAVATTPKISSLLQTTTNHYAVQCLQICSESYQRSISKLTVVDFSVINRQDYSELNGDIGAAFYEFQDCEECFTERPGTSPSPLTPENQNLGNICKVVIEIINFVKLKKKEKNKLEKNGYAFNWILFLSFCLFVFLNCSSDWISYIHIYMLSACVHTTPSLSDRLQETLSCAIC
ncbi:hypothetical protein ACJIZ3_016026 [Penstemon smallii]|uniref:Pectinesterase inhibitor domain-containing protein n=1 Tax=Penstemon smallii TaxID=265156 RepID=A0ABD3RPC8_9LAMI